MGGLKERLCLIVIVLVNVIVSINGVNVDWTGLGGDGLWSNKKNWDPKFVPSNDTDTANIDTNSTVILNMNVKIAAFNFHSGVLVMEATDCPSDWMGLGDRCFGANPVRLPWEAAELECGKRNHGHLMTVENDDDNSLAQALCRGVGRGGEAGLGEGARGGEGEEAVEGMDEACWFGLHQSSERVGDGWDWSSPLAVQQTYRWWQEGQPSGHNRSLTEGEHCAVVAPSLTDPEAQTRVRWADEWCGSSFPSLCEMPGSTTTYQLTVTGATTWTGGELWGGGLLLAQGGVSLSGGSKRLSHRAQLRISGGSSSWTGGALLLGAAARLRLSAALIIQLPAAEVATSHVLLASNATAWVVVEEGGSLTAASPLPSDLVSSAGDAPLPSAGTRLEPVLLCAGALRLAAAVSGAMAAPLWCTGGGALMGTVDVGTDLLRLSGAFALAQPELQRLSLRAPLQLTPSLQGVYRLSFSHGGAGAEEDNVTPCLAYGANASYVQTALNALPSVAAAGGVKVVRYGDGGVDWGFGFDYQVVFDRAGGDVEAVAAAGSGAVDLLAVDGWGEAVGCAVPTAAAETQSAEDGLVTYHCAAGEHSTAEASDRVGGVPRHCTASPAITTATLQDGGRADVVADVSGGALQCAGGEHRLAPVLGGTVALRASDGARVVSGAAATDWGHVTVDSGALLVLAGGGAEGRAQAALFYAAACTPGRDEPGLQSGSWGGAATGTGATTATLASLTIDDGELQVAGSSDRETRVQLNGPLLWSGGVVSGFMNLVVSSAGAELSGGSKRLRAGVQLQTNGVTAWTGGDIIMDHSTLISNGGTWTVTAAEAALRKGDPVAHKQWAGHWYTNPVCHTGCVNRDTTWRTLTSLFKRNVWSFAGVGSGFNDGSSVEENARAVAEGRRRPNTLSGDYLPSVATYRPLTAAAAGPHRSEAAAHGLGWAATREGSWALSDELDLSTPLFVNRNTLQWAAAGDGDGGGSTRWEPTLYSLGAISLLATGASLELRGGGWNVGMVTVSPGCTLELRGASFHNVVVNNLAVAFVGGGAVNVTLGRHLLPPDVGVDLTVEGGEAIFDDALVTFSGSVSLQAGGAMVFNAPAVQVELQSELRIGGAASVGQPGGSSGSGDGGGGPKEGVGRPSGTGGGYWLMRRYETAGLAQQSNKAVVNIRGDFSWSGGSIDGYAEVISHSALRLTGGDKTLRGAVHLTSPAQTLWYAGSVLTFERAQLTNQGVLHVADDMIGGAAVWQADTHDDCCVDNPSRLHTWQ